MAGSMAGRLQHRDFEPGQLQHISIRQAFEALRRGVVPRWDLSQQLAKLLIGMEGQIIVVRVYIGADTGRTHEFSGAANVVDVAVGDQQGHRRQVMFSEKLGYATCARRRIDDDRQPAGFGSGNEGIGLRQPQGLSVEEHGPGG